MHGETPQCFPVQQQKNFKAQQKISKEDNRKEKEESTEKNNEKEENIEKNNEIKKEDIVNEEMEDVLKEFFDNIGEAITSTPIPGEKLQELQAQAIAMDDEMNNFLKNIPIDHTPITHTFSSGKSTFLLKFISQAADLIHPPPKSTLYCFGEMSSIVPKLQRSGVSVYAGVPTEDVINRLLKPSLIILDDLLLSIEEKYLSELFTKKSHHQNFGIVFVTQNLFEKKIKVARQNAQYIVIMRSPNSVLAVRNIGVQLFPRQLEYFLDAYRQATKIPYGYMLIDMHASSDSNLRLRTNIFKDDEEKIIFISKNGK
uniref:Uncharacterized protein n=1 Tax=Meloidogyne incognita TaxID=6306 RepID=A0A914KKT7_MELIC